MSGTVAQRRNLRQSLIEQGFTRTQFTTDSGDGVYTEHMDGPLGHVVITWSARIPTVVPPVNRAKIAEMRDLGLCGQDWFGGEQWHYCDEPGRDHGTHTCGCGASTNEEF